MPGPIQKNYKQAFPLIKNTIVFFSVLHFFFSTIPLNAQDISYARKVVDTLAHEVMQGRGYVNKGLQKATTFIQNEFKNSGLLSLSDNYLQEFKHPVNTFAGAMQIQAEDKTLTAGKDFIINPASTGYKGELEIVWLTDSIINNKKIRKKFLAGDYSKCAIIIDTTSQEKPKKTGAHYIINKLQKQPPVIIYVTEKKLTWHVSPYSMNTTEIIAVKNVIKKNNRKIKLNIESYTIPGFSSNNIIGYVKGTEMPDSFIVFSAHYDHLGCMGKGTIFYGANDNASGVSMLLSIAKYYSKKPHKYSIVFIAFAGEEIGLLGSNYFTNNPLIPLNKIKFLLNMDIVGTGEEGITVVNGSVHTTEFNSLVNINNEAGYLKQIKARGKAKNSDHYFFSEKGVPAFFIYTMGGISAYHDIDDKPGTLPLTKFEDLFKLITTFANKL